MSVLSRFVRLSREEEGFTLIELLVVVAIIALLTAFAVPRLFDAVGKSKDARGQGDMGTYPAALDRYYFDNSAFPKPASAGTAVADVKAALAPNYLKSTAKYKNGYDKGYIYFTDATGSMYVFVDSKNTTAAVNLSCPAKLVAGGASTTATGSATPGSDLQVVTVTASGGAAATVPDVSQCTFPTGVDYATN